MKVCVFCSASGDIDAAYFEAAEMLGKRLAEEGHTVVFGGCDMGLMETVARAARARGGRTIGVVPKRIEEHGRVSDNIDVLIPCENLTDRKAIMMAQSDVFVALPGGVGSLDEIFTVAAMSTIGYHSKKVILCNINGAWNSLVALLDDLKDKHLIRGDWHRVIEVVDSPDFVL